MSTLQSLIGSIQGVRAQFTRGSMVKRESGGTPSAPSTAKAARIQEDLAKTLSRFVRNACEGEARASRNVGEINDLRYTMPYVSQTALASIIRYSREHGGLPSAAADRREIRYARDVTTVKNETPFGPLHRSVQIALAGAGGGQRGGPRPMGHAVLCSRGVRVVFGAAPVHV